VLLVDVLVVVVAVVVDVLDVVELVVLDVVVVAIEQIAVDMSMIASGRRIPRISHVAAALLQMSPACGETKLPVAWTMAPGASVVIVAGVVGAIVAFAGTF
jgi:hypothetical protein